ncbi:uncharacterized protein LOC120643599 isoform X2 [Panicum virgatum]|nr:uncharacterized protein LOC120643599 isoform X2 [Panicum virgatum]
MVIKYMIWSLDLLILEVSVYINCPPQEGRCIARRIIPCKVHQSLYTITMVCTALSRKLVEECIRPRFQAFAPVVHINGRHYLNVTTQNAQQKEHLKSQFLKEQSLGGKTDGREESCSCYSGLHARHAVHVQPAAGGRIHRVL